MDSARSASYIAEFVGKSVGGWPVQDFVGAGKSAIVFKTSDGTNDRAIKIFDRELVERFGEEAQAERIRRELTLVGLSHPHLIRVYGGGKCPVHNVYFVVMDYQAAAPLSDVLSSVPRQSIWALVGQIADAARFLESLSLCHRDIKPSNIVVSSDFKTATLLDLGVLRPFGSASWTPVTDDDQLSFVGTLQYSSPEALFRTEEDSEEGWRALTFYQLGTVFHDLIMKKPIFDSFTSPFSRLVEAVKSETPIIKAADVPPDLILLARNCLIKPPKIRLSVVKWEDFQPKEPDSRASVDAKERMRRRRVLARQSAAQPERENKEVGARRILRLLTDFQAKLEEVFREECVSNDAFPRMSVHSEINVQDHAATTRVSFPASIDHDLAIPLHLFVRLRMIDVDASVVRLSYAAIASDSVPVVPETISVNLFEGVFELSVIKREMQEMLYVVFDAAQTHEPTDASNGDHLIEIKDGLSNG